MVAVPDMARDPDRVGGQQTNRWCALQQQQRNGGVFKFCSQDAWCAPGFSDIFVQLLLLFARVLGENERGGSRGERRDENDV